MSEELRKENAQGGTERNGTTARAKAAKVRRGTARVWEQATTADDR